MFEEDFNDLDNTEEIKKKLDLFGYWRAKVISNEDSEERGAITVTIPDLGFDEMSDVLPMFGLYSSSIPKPDMWVFVVFHQLDEEKPYYMPCEWTQDSRTHPDQTRKPDQHIKQIVDDSNEKLYTIQIDEEKQLIIIDHKKEAYIQFKTESGNEQGAINIFSDTANGVIPVHINGKLVDSTGFPAARQFDPTEHICVVTGAPVLGYIKDGSKRVILQNDQLDTGNVGDPNAPLP